MILEKVYDPKKVEEKIYKSWEKSGFFNPDNLPKRRKRKFSIVLPPPNVTGSLHMGHALNSTIQDILIRQKRMQGFKTVWVPGTDHAGIATQYVVEKKLKSEGKTRFDLGREKFLEKIWEWVEKYGEIILEQFKKIGCSLDWSRKKFTLDKDYQKAVKEAFFYFYKKGLIYRKKRPINWCRRCKTSLSDLEIEYKEKKGNLWYLKYPLKKGGFIVVATTRPETLLGDVALAVNPKDERYKKLIGEKAILPIVKREIKIISDNLVDPDFGTGVVKVTPAHDILDFEIAQKKKLPLIQVIDEEGKMTGKIPRKYRGLSTLEARGKIIEDLKKEGLLEKVEDYLVSLPTCYRCHQVLEVIPSWQWYLKMKNLAKKAILAVRSGKVKIIPKKFEKIYFDWLKSAKDWCISRQIWWGHKIPLKGEKDVLDTWFSSALWPFAVFGWPKKTKDLKEFYPTDVLSTARDIINLWVARMIFCGLEFMKEVPFKRVFIHPTVLTKEGKRMSKSLGTGVDPLELIEKYGADATRFGLIWQVKGGQDLRFDESFCQAGKKFCNKIWNASRFVLISLENESFTKKELERIKKSKTLTKEDKEILKGLKEKKKEIQKQIENFEFGKAAESLYHFFWHKFCDSYIEISKKQLKRKKTKKTTQKVLLFVLFSLLKFLHPFVPFITEEIYQKLPLKDKKEFLMIEDW